MLDCLDWFSKSGADFELGFNSNSELHVSACLFLAGQRHEDRLNLNGKMESVGRATVTTDYTDYTDFTERIGLEIAVRTFTSWVSGHGDITYSKSV